jgi:hypothetical protein
MPPKKSPVSLKSLKGNFFPLAGATALLWFLLAGGGLMSHDFPYLLGLSAQSLPANGLDLLFLFTLLNFALGMGRMSNLSNFPKWICLYTLLLGFYALLRGTWDVALVIFWLSFLIYSLASNYKEKTL